MIDQLKLYERINLYASSMKACDVLGDLQK